MTSNEDTQKDTKKSVLDAIKEKRITMRSKFYFTFETFLAVFAALVMLIVTVALVNFILFSIRVNGHDSLLMFGPRGFLTFFLIFPWFLLILDILLAFFLERLLRRFKFGYRSPILYLLLGILVLAVLFGLVLDRGTPVNDTLLHDADDGGLPAPFGELYEHIRAPAPHDRGIYRGTIDSIGTSTITIDDEDATTTQVYVVEFPPGFATSSLAVGDRVYVAGDASGNVIQAFGVRAFPAYAPPPAP